MNAAGAGPAAAKTVTYQVTVGTVGSLTAISARYDRIKLTWAAVADATSYEVYRAMSSTGTYTLLSTTTALTLTDTSLTTGKRYYYKVRAVRSVEGTDVFGAYSAIRSAVPVPASVTSVVAKSARYDRVKVTWAAVTGASGYQVYRATSKTGTYKRVTTTTSRSFTNTSLTTGKRYYYKVRAYRVVAGKNVYGPWSAIKSAVPVPAAPATVSAKRATAKSVKVAWSAASGATGYQVYRATSKTGTYKRVTTTTSRSFTNTSLTTGKRYYYKVRAYRVMSGKRVYGPWSAIKSAVPTR